MPEDGAVVFHQTLELAQRSKSMFDVEIAPDGGLIVFIDELEIFFTDPDTVPLFETTHLVITHLDSDGFETGQADRTRLYINGVLHSEQGDTAELPVFPENDPSNDTLYIGVSLLGGGIFRGAWDDLQRYDVELTGDQVASMFANPGSVAGPEEPPPSPFEIVGFSVDTITRTSTITWTSVPGRTYALEISGDLEDWNVAEGDIDASDGSTTSVDHVFEAGSRVLNYQVVEQ